MNEWNDGYFTSDTYTYGYYNVLSPTYQRFCLLLRGFVAPEQTEDSTYCELGYGQGVSINIHAAATPGKFFGTDFNPAQAAQANELCQISGCGAKLFEDSFEQMLNRDDLPQFDSINLHGIWSWISTENQKIVVEFARKYLKSGGIFYNSYNCFPGWAPNSPMRELFILYDKFIGHNKTNTFDRIEGALKFTEDMFAEKPLYVQRVPGLAPTLESVKKQDHNYLAHEYFNRDWICMYFTDVAEMLSEAKLEFACTANPGDHFDQINLTENAIKFLNKIQNPIMREQIRDYFVNQQFRQDLYLRGIRRLSASERTERILNTRFVLLKSKNISFNCATTLGQMNLTERLGQPIVEYLSSQNYKPKTFTDFIKTHKKMSMAEFEQAIVFLIINGTVAPCQSEEAVKIVKNRCDLLNDYFCNKAKNADYIPYLASPVIGGAIIIGRFEQIFTLLFKQDIKNADGLARETWKFIEAQGQRLVKEGKALNSAEENIAELESLAQTFLDERVPILKALQIV